MKAARPLRRAIKRTLVVGGARVIVQLRPDGTLRIRGRYQRRWYTVNLADVLAIARTEVDGSPSEQLNIALGVVAREASEPKTREGSHHA